MEIILLENIKNLGKIGDIVSLVKPDSDLITESKN